MMGTAKRPAGAGCWRQTFSPHPLSLARVNHGQGFQEGELSSASSVVTLVGFVPFAPIT
jgi:hypothetical protein